ncbi:hypothetical protein C8R44DRAFT_814872 [Mycena epipterygia]|nr:hypothetical protein C8R44DRAFT_814872 [Mycena epipterygia]
MFLSLSSLQTFSPLSSLILFSRVLPFSCPVAPTTRSSTFSFRLPACSSDMRSERFLAHLHRTFTSSKQSPGGLCLTFVDVDSADILTTFFPWPRKVDPGIILPL